MTFVVVFCTLNNTCTGLQYKKARLVLVGLDDGGKTSLMYMLKESRITQTFPTERPSKLILYIGTFIEYHNLVAAR